MRQSLAHQRLQSKQAWPGKQCEPGLCHGKPASSDRRFRVLDSQIAPAGSLVARFVSRGGCQPSPCRHTSCTVLPPKHPILESWPTEADGVGSLSISVSCRSAMQPSRTEQHTSEFVAPGRLENLHNETALSMGPTSLNPASRPIALCVLFSRIVFLITTKLQDDHCAGNLSSRLLVVPGAPSNF